MGLSVILGKYLVEWVLMYILMSLGAKAFGINSITFFQKLVLSGACAVVTIPILVMF